LEVSDGFFAIVVDRRRVAKTLETVDFEILVVRRLAVFTFELDPSWFARSEEHAVGPSTFACALELDAGDTES
jgi:hypothetical protein